MGGGCPYAALSCEGESGGSLRERGELDDGGLRRRHDAAAAGQRCGHSCRSFASSRGGELKPHRARKPPSQNRCVAEEPAPDADGDREISSDPSPSTSVHLSERKTRPPRRARVRSRSCRPRTSRRRRCLSRRRRPHFRAPRQPSGRGELGEQAGRSARRPRPSGNPRSIANANGPSSAGGGTAHQSSLTGRRARRPVLRPSPAGLQLRLAWTLGQLIDPYVGGPSGAGHRPPWVECVPEEAGGPVVVGGELEAERPGDESSAPPRSTEKTTSGWATPHSG